MCLVRSEFPSGTVLPWQNCCFLPLHCLLEMRKNKKAKDSKRRVEGLPGKFPGTNNVQITASETDRCYREGAGHTELGVGLKGVFAQGANSKSHYKCARRCSWPLLREIEMCVQSGG